MLIELRRYSVLPGNMDSMHGRMSGLLMPMFADHDIPTPTAIWEDKGERSTFTWIVQWPSFEQRLAAWTSIAPAFAAARQAQGGEEFVTRTTLTLLTPWNNTALDLGSFDPERCETCWQAQPRVGKGLSFIDHVSAAIPRLRDLGVTGVDGFNLQFGALPAAFLLLGWPDRATRERGTNDARRLLGGNSAALLAGPGEWEELDRAAYLSEALGG